MMRRFAVIAFVLLHAVAAAQQEVQRVQAGGVAVSFEYLAPTAAGDTGRTLLQFSDAASERGLPGLQPVAWWVARRSPAQAETACADRARQLAAGSLGSRADVDLNGYRLVTVNQDRTVAFIDPFVRVHTSRLQALVELPAKGHDVLWLRAPRLLLVSLPDADAVAVIDAATRKLRGLVAMPPGSRPTRLAEHSGHDGRAWVGLDGSGEAALIDAQALRSEERLAVGTGALTLVAAPGTPWLAVAGSARVHVIDRENRRAVASASFGGALQVAAWSEAAQRFVLADSTTARLALLDAQGALSMPIPLGESTESALAVTLFDQGRRALVAQRALHRVSLIDLASASVQAHTSVANEPDQIALSSDYAYVRSVTEATLTLLPLAAARSGRLEPVRVPLGSAAPQDAPRALNDAPMVVATPEGRGAWIAHAPDRQMYRYAEGLMAASGSVGNDRRQPRALLVLDDGLREREAGRFEAVTLPPHGGSYDVIVALGQPALAACFTVQAAGPSAQEAARAAERVKGRVTQIEPSDGGALAVRLELTDARDAPLTGVRDLELMVFDARSQWQQRVVLSESAPGQWQARVAAPAQADTSRMVWMIASRELDVAFAGHRLAFEAGRP